MSSADVAHPSHAVVVIQLVAERTFLIFDSRTTEFKRLPSTVQRFLYLPRYRTWSRVFHAYAPRNDVLCRRHAFTFLLSQLY